MKIKKSALPESIYLTKEQFNSQLEIHLLIISEPKKRKPYYVCESTTKRCKKIVHIYIK